MDRTKNETALGLREKVLADAENRPGIYRFVGPRNEVLYLGKSVRLRARLLTYFRGEQAKEKELLRVARTLEWDYVPSAFEAMLREFRLIRAFRPPYNQEFRRDRAFAWIRMTRDPAPRLVATRTPPLDGSRSFGPFPAQRSLPRRLRDLAKLVGLRDCPDSTHFRFSDQLELLADPSPPKCIRADFANCLAPCAGRCSWAEYQAGVREAESFLTGQTDGPLHRLGLQIETAVARKSFELAARLRDRETGLRTLRDRVVSTCMDQEKLTFFYRVPTADHTFRVYLLQRGRVILTADEPRAGEDAARERLLRQVQLRMGDRGRLLGLPSRPPLGSTPTREERETDVEELFLVARWFRSKPSEWERVVPPSMYLDWLKNAGPWIPPIPLDPPPRTDAQDLGSTGSEPDPLAGPTIACASRAPSPEAGDRP